MTTSSREAQGSLGSEPPVERRGAGRRASGAPATWMGPGDQVGRYELVAEIGRGSGGVVYEAVLHGPRGFRKAVAVKVLPRPERSEPLLEEMLLREARVGAELHHPNVVDVYELVQVDGQWLVAMELVRGPSLHERLRSGPLAGPAAVDLGIQVCRGLSHLHERGLVHRDIKPGNLLLDPSGAVKIVDFGLAGAGNAAARGGTPGYLAPEQLSRDPIDGRADLFSLGAVLAEAVLGTALLPPGAAGVRGAGRAAKVARDHLGRLDAPLPGIGAVVVRCLEPDPADRFGSAEELAAALAPLAPYPGRRSLGSGGPAAVEAPRPEPPEPLIGRDLDLDPLVERVVERGGLITLVGAGGVGKTTLAGAVAHRVRAVLPGGAWWVDLTDAHTLERVCFAVAAVLNLPLGGDPAEAVSSGLRRLGRALVVLDNVEQLVPLAAATFARWAAEAPDLALLCTSRVPLRSKAEDRRALDRLATADGVHLLRTRAPWARLEDPAAAALVEAVDGLPLAIELLAARTRVVPVERLAALLQDRLRLLSGGEHDRPARHRSIRASLEATTALLSPGARRALAQLVVFEGGATFEAIHAVLDASAMPPSGFLVDTVQELAEASLIGLVGDRFRLPVLVQAFADEALAPADRDRAQERHGGYFAELGAPEVLDAARGPRETEVVRGLTAELDNLVGACRRAVDRSDAEVAARTCLAAQVVLGQRGPFGAGVALGRQVLQLDGLSPVQRLEVQLETEQLANQAGEVGAARRGLEDAARAAERLGDPRWIARAQHYLATLLREQGQVEAAQTALESALAAAREAGDELTEAWVLLSLGNVAKERVRLDEAKAIYELAITRLRRVGSPARVARAGAMLATAHFASGAPEVAVELLREALGPLRAHGDLFVVGNTLANLGVALLTLGRLDEADAALHEALLLVRRVGRPAVEGNILTSLAGTALTRGDLHTAWDRHVEAALVLEQVGHKRNLAGNHHGFGETAIALGRLDEARAHLEAAARLMMEFGDPRGRAHMRVLLARVAVLQGDLARARELVDAGDHELEALGATYERVNAALVRAELARAQGDRGGAVAALRDGRALAEQTGNPAVLQEIEAAEAKQELLTDESS